MAWPFTPKAKQPDPKTFPHYASTPSSVERRDWPGPQDHPAEAAARNHSLFNSAERALKNRAKNKLAFDLNQQAKRPQPSTETEYPWTGDTPPWPTFNQEMVRNHEDEYGETQQQSLSKRFYGPQWPGNHRYELSHEIAPAELRLTKEEFAALMVRYLVPGRDPKLPADLGGTTTSGTHSGGTSDLTRPRRRPRPSAAFHV